MKARGGMLLASRRASRGRPFLLTLPLGLIGLYLRLRLDETPQFQQVPQERCGPSAPLLTAVREHWRSMLKVVGLILMGNTVTYMLQAFWPAFLVQEVGLSQAEMFTAMLISICIQLVLIPLCAAIADVFPTEVRYSGLSIAYSAAVWIFGGFTPLLLTFLVERTGDVMAPAYYLTATAVLSPFAAVIFTETGQRPTAPERVEAVG